MYGDGKLERFTMCLIACDCAKFSPTSWFSHSICSNFWNSELALTGSEDFVKFSKKFS